MICMDVRVGNVRKEYCKLGKSKLKLGESKLNEVKMEIQE